jgi:hypothetical protein
LEREAGGEALVHELYGFELELRRVLPLAMWLTTTHEHLLSSERFEVSTKSGQLHPLLERDSSSRQNLRNFANYLGKHGMGFPR